MLPAPERTPNHEMSKAHRCASRADFRSRIFRAGRGTSRTEVAHDAAREETGDEPLTSRQSASARHDPLLRVPTRRFPAHIILAGTITSDLRQ